PANVPDSVVAQINQCKPDHEVNNVVLEVPASSKSSKENNMDSFLSEINKKKIKTFVASLDSVTSLNEKNGQECFIKRGSDRLEITSKEIISEDKQDAKVSENSGNGPSSKSVMQFLWNLLLLVLNVVRRWRKNPL
ncbi:17292_t:CDS:2, partial [Acaulospora morrowiae]